MLHGEFLPAGSFGGTTTVDKQMHFQTYSYTGASSTNTGGIAKTQRTGPETGNGLFSFVGSALLSSLSYSEHPFHLHTVV